MTTASVPHAHSGSAGIDLMILLLAGIAIAAYLGGVASSRRRGRRWPLWRVALWCAGITVATASVVGPLAQAAHDDFVAHMWGHLLAGMLAPILLVLAAPVTLALRTLAVTPARRLSRMLRSLPARIVAHPVTAALLSGGGLWVLYVTPTFAAMQDNPLLHLIVQGHMLAAGYLFTAAIIGVDPRAHRPTRMLNAIVLVLAIASHGILAKYVYAHAPLGVSVTEAQAGAQTMYYAGAWIEAIVIVAFCSQWYAAVGRQPLSHDDRPSTLAAQIDHRANG